MAKSSPRMSYAFCKRGFVVVVILLLLCNPAFAKVRKATSRVLSIPYDVVTTRKANFKPGDILGTPLISMTINNDETPAFLLLQLDIDFGGTWESESASVELVKKFASNENLTFSNTDLLDYVADIRSGQTSEGLMDAVGISSFSDAETVISSITSFPEGTYTIGLKAFEITLSDPNNIRSSIIQQGSALKSEEVTFNVVTIGSISILKTPTVEDPSLTFQVPEIPFYNDASIATNSSTKVTITGAGVSETLSKNHGRSRAAFSTAIKGYPSDLPDGEVTYDLSSIPFRAGERYTVAIEYNDGYGYSITSKTIALTSFTAPRLTTSIDTTSPYQPEFVWNFSGLDYTPWVKEYRIYLNGNYLGYTTANSYSVSSPLSPGTAYSWYVMPINKDGTPFFSSPSALSKSFTTKNHDQLEIRLISPNSNATLLTGESYTFEGIATFFDEATQKSATWKIGTESKNGTAINYTPTKRYTANSLVAQLNVTDSLNLSKNSANLYCTVLDPAIAIEGGSFRTINKEVSTWLSIDSQKTRDLQKVEWFANGELLGTGNQINPSFSESKSYDIYAEGTSIADFDGKTKSVQSPTIKVTVVGEGPVISITRPTFVVEVPVGNSLELLSEISHENELSSVTWSMTGTENGNLGTSPSRATFTPNKEGEYTISVQAVDIHGKDATASIKVMAIDPKISLTSPTANTVFALNSILTPVIQAPNAKRITWFVNNREIPGTSLALSSFGIGTYELYARASWDAVDSQGNPKVFTKDSSKITFTVKDLVPPSVTIQFPRNDMQLKTGTTYTLQASAQSSSLRQSWWEVEGVRLGSNTFTPSPSLGKKVLTLTYKALNSDGIIGSKSVSVKLANPAVYLTKPASSSFLVGSTIPIGASVVDGELFWVVDDKEIADWDKTIGTTGNHTIQAGWSLNAVDSNGNQKTFKELSEKATVTVFSDKPPQIIAKTPSEDIIHQLFDVPVIFSVTASSENTLEQTKWNIYSEGTSIREVSATSISHRSWAPGLYTVKAEVSDAQNLSTSHEWTVKIINPKAIITFPERGMTFAKNQVPVPVVSTEDVSSYTLTVDGKPAGPDFNWNGLALGNHTLVATGSYSVLGKSGLQQTAGHTVSFSIENRTPPSFEAEGFHDNDRIVAGLRYNFQASVSNGETLQWFKNGSLVSSSRQYSFTPIASEKTIELKLRGKLNNLTVDKTYNLNVIDPFVSITIAKNLSINNLYAPNTPIPLQYEGRDIDRVQWRVDLRPYTGQSVSFSPGMHSIDLEGYATQVRLPDGTLGDYMPTNTNGITGKDIQVAEVFRAWDLSFEKKAYTGEPLMVAVTTTSDENFGELIDSLTYLVDGKLYKEEKKPLLKSITVSGLAAGPHTIGVISTDIFNNQWKIEKPVMLYNPLTLSISRPTEGERISPDTNIVASMQIESGKPELITWRNGSSILANSNNATVSVGKLPAGRQTLSVSARDPLGKIVSASVRFEVQSDFQLNLIQPNRFLETLVGNPVTYLVGVDKVAGSTVNLSDAAKDIHWLVNGQDTNQTGLSYVFDAEQVGLFTIQARYSSNNMVRTTAEQKITVRDIAQPVITKPLNGEMFTYLPMQSIPLEAQGEQGATYTWMIGDTVIAMGAKTSFNPEGRTGLQQIRLVSTSFNKTKESLASIHLKLNTAPNLDLSVPSIQYTGDTLALTASAFDVEDKVTNPNITFSLDGILLQNHTQRILSDADIGAHTLTASTTDSSGTTTTKQAVFNVESNRIPLAIQSPREGETYYKEFAIPLIASLGEGGGPSAKNGTFTWTVQYLDNPAVAKQVLSGNSLSFTGKSLGNAEVILSFVDGKGKERARQKVSFQIKSEPLKLSINWPHGSVVNASQALHPQLLGLPDNVGNGTVFWNLNGMPLASISDLKAPDFPGFYTLSSQYVTEISSDKASIGFTVNGKPSITITSPLASEPYKAGSPVVLSAKTEDDQSLIPTIVWTKEDQTILGEGNPLILESPEAGLTKITATATDSYGAKGMATVTMQVYNPISDITCFVNNGQPTYLVDQNTPPLTLKTLFSGGINPLVTWRLQQDNRYMEKTGKEAYFVFGELSQFARNPAMLTVLVTDTSTAGGTSGEIYRKDFPILLTSEATAMITSPIAGDVQRIGTDVPLQMALTGFKAPLFTIMVNGKVVNTKFEPLEGNLLYQGILEKSLFSAEGVYEIVVTVSENGIVKSDALSLNLYGMRTGIFVDDAPQAFALSGESKRIEAVVSNLPTMDAIQWRTDLQAEPVATGPILDLKEAGLKPGNRSITVEALSGEEVLSSFTFPLKVTGLMSIKVEPDENLMILMRGAKVKLSASAQDTEGNELPQEAITWTSHLDGLVATAKVLDFSLLPNLKAGVHVFTITATGIDGSTVSVLKQVQVNVEAAQPVQDQMQASGNGGQPNGIQIPQGPILNMEPPPVMDFGAGTPIQNAAPPSYFSDPFGPGPGGNPIPNDLSSGMSSFFNSYGGGMGGFGGNMGAFGGPGF
ncbi:hypothetical protein SpiGrapes_0965 [Sphaerochaeta pleomorpha str. Grapes]|uniref:Ig-like domain-containing protein n=1 Tax=Sphaerochaeta pleomorpha (strain ATCC BAA-1885 / DSM 22778 / Grapes) TaxID=158190 RepID=G8QRD7_SPHPG|nr:hypothetical protein [Sphaerochaeta pleomorpha]AEV28790.1 hypothetical protein SpiGrapes_0965 [Sphaerochaeta pleomorpha str. Grapes]